MYIFATENNKLNTERYKLMAKEERITSWLDHVHEDISSAECLFMGGHWLYYTHSHTRLLNVCGLTDELTDAQLRFIALMEPMYIEARYP